MNDLEFSKEIRLAIRDGDIDRVSALLGSHPGQLNTVTPFGTWLHVASRVGNLDVVKLLVGLGADIDLPAGTFEASALKTAVSSGQMEIVAYLLSLGAEMDLSEPFKNPLFAAIYNGRLDIVMLLLDHGVDTTVRYTGENMKDMDAIAYARRYGQHHIAEILARTNPARQQLG